jgi:hypothetical protein
MIDRPINHEKWLAKTILDPVVRRAALAQPSLLKSPASERSE